MDIKAMYEKEKRLANIYKESIQPHLLPMKERTALSLCLTLTKEDAIASLASTYGDEVPFIASKDKTKAESTDHTDKIKRFATNIYEDALKLRDSIMVACSKSRAEDTAAPYAIATSFKIENGMACTLFYLTHAIHMANNTEDPIKAAEWLVSKSAPEYVIKMLFRNLLEKSCQNQ